MMRLCCEGESPFVISSSVLLPVHFFVRREDFTLPSKQEMRHEDTKGRSGHEDKKLVLFFLRAFFVASCLRGAFILVAACPRCVHPRASAAHFLRVFALSR